MPSAVRVLSPLGALAVICASLWSLSAPPHELAGNSRNASVSTTGAAGDLLSDLASVTAAVTEPIPAGALPESVERVLRASNPVLPIPDGGDR
jgi:hypothetical protein